MLEVNEQLRESIDSGSARTLNSYVIIRRDAKPEESTGGIILPENQYVAPDWVTILVVPETVSDRFSKGRKCHLKSGVRAFVRPAAGQKLWDLDKSLQVCHHRDVVATEENGRIIPFDHYILVKKAPRQETFTNSIIIIPENIRTDLESEDRGIVVAIGDQVGDVQPGDKVVFGPESGLVINKEERIYALPIDEVLGILDE